MMYFRGCFGYRLTARQLEFPLGMHLTFCTIVESSYLKGSVLERMLRAVLRRFWQDNEMMKRPPSAVFLFVFIKYSIYFVGCVVSLADVLLYTHKTHFLAAAYLELFDEHKILDFHYTF